MTAPLPEADLIGREREMGALKAAIEHSLAGAGSAVLMRGEPGVGKTRLIEAFREMAGRMGMKCLSGASSQVSAKPFLAFSQALAGIVANDLFERKSHSSFSLVMASHRDGRLLAHASPPGMEADAEATACMIAAVQEFVRDSFAVSAGAGLGKLELSGKTLLAEHGQSFTVVGVVQGPECPEMREALRSFLSRIEDAACGAEPTDGFGAKVLQDEASRLAGISFSVRTELSGVGLEGERLRIADEALRCIVAESRDRPVALFLEDMHWADEGSLTVLRLIASGIRKERVLVICTTRGSEGERANAVFDRMVGDRIADRLVLEGLDAAGVSGLVDSQFHPNDFPAQFAKMLHADCAGNPLFVTELLRQMAADGAIAVVDGKHRLVRSDYSVPATVDEVVRRRISTLDDDALAIAEYASCFGRDFPVSAVLAMPEARDAAGAAERLRESGIVAVQGDAGSFVHALFQSSVYAGISKRWLPSHHRSIGEWFERAFHASPHDAAYELARHFSLTSEHGKAHCYCMMAGAKAEASYAMEQAAESYRAALASLVKARSLPDLPAKKAEAMERLGDVSLFMGASSAAAEAYGDASEAGLAGADAARLKRKQAEARFRLGEYDASLSLIQDAEALLAGADGPELGRALMSESQVRVVFGQLDEGLSALERALAIFQSGAGRGSDLGTVLKHIGVIHWRRGEFAEAARRFSEGLGVFEAEGNLRGASAVLNNLGLVHSHMGQPGKALECYRRAIEMMERIGDKYSLTMAYNNMGLLHVDLGQPEPALEYYKRSHALRELIGDKGGMTGTLVNMGNLLMGMGRYEEAGAMLEQAVTLSQELGDRKNEAGSKNALGCLRNILGDQDEAYALFRDSLAICEEIGENYILAHALDNRGMVLLDGGDGEGALAEFTRSLELRQQMGDRTDEPWTRYELARAHLSLGDIDRATEQAEAGRAIAEEMGLSMETGANLMALGMAMDARGRHDEALELLSRSAEKMKMSGHRSFYAEALYESAQVHLKTGDRERAKVLMEEALTEFEAMRTRKFIGKCREALDALDKTSS